mgnify:CR=1 FL=1|jgi:hypothetical protein
MPEGWDTVWHAFLDLNGARRDGPIAWADLDAYARLNGHRFARVELQALRALDSAFLRHYAGRLKEARAHG